MRPGARSALLAASAALLGCAIAASPVAAQNERVTDGFADPVPTRGMRPVPRGAAPSALVSRQIQGYADDVIDKFAAVPAIVIAPSGMTQEQKDEFSRTFRATPDGFFARLTFDDYDVVINGTLAYSVAPDSLRFQRRTGRYFVQKAEGETGISFSDFGGDYLIQFICHEFTEGMEGGCVEDQDAIALFERLVPLGGGLE